MSNDLPCIGCDTQEGCGTGMGNWPKPGDPSNNSVLTATPAFGGVDVSWSFPDINPQAVAHTRLYRAYTNDFNGAALHAIVAGNFFYDKNTSEIPIVYYYWIQIVSVNGTYGEVIGPAWAMPKPTIEEMIEMLTGKIDAGVLAQSLKQDIDKIEINTQSIIDEANARFTANQALSDALAQVQNNVDGSVTYINEEITNRVEGQDALLKRINSLAVGSGDLAAAIISEQEARIEGDTVLARDIQTLFTKNEANEAGIITERQARIDADTALAGEQTTIKASVDANTAAINQEASTRASETEALASQITQLGVVTSNDKAQLEAQIVEERNARVAQNEATATELSRVAAAVNTADGKAVQALAAVQTETEARVAADEALSSQITTAQSQLHGEIASVQTNLSTNIQSVDGKVTAIGALYTAKVSVNGLIGGFGVYNDGTEVEAGFDVDRFWVGRTQDNKRKPFIIEGGIVYVDDAAINKLTFTKLRAEDGSLIFQNGKLQASYIDVDSLVVNTAQSKNFVYNQSGWRLAPDGEFQLNGSSGSGRMVITNQLISIYDSNNVLRVRLGLW